jgi:hypothetical protein
MKRCLSLVLSLGLFLLSSQGFAKGVCDEFFPQEIQNSLLIHSQNEHGACIAEKAAIKEIDNNAMFIGEISTTETQFKLYESLDNKYGLFIVEDSYFDQEPFIPLVVVLTAVAIDFGLIGVMYGVYATQR